MTEFSQTYWNELIEKYRNGTISEEERFQLEKQALDDPFLFDALEGFALHQQAIRKEKKFSKIFTLPRIAIAASLILLVAVMVNLNPVKDDDQSLAMVLEEDRESTTDDEAFDAEGVSIENSDVAQTETTDPKKKISDISKKPQKDIIATKPQKITPPESIDRISVVSEEEIAEAEQPQVTSAAKPETEVLGESDVDAKVMDEVVTVQDSDKAEEVVGASNFESIENKPEGAIVPLENKSKERKEKSIPTDIKNKASIYFEALPVIGKEIFDDYAKQRIDERGLRQEKPQKVIIEFTIDKNGNLTDFRHIFSGCSECGPFAISLLQKSGEWKTVPPGFSGKARYTFTF